MLRSKGERGTTPNFSEKSMSYTKFILFTFNSLDMVAPQKKGSVFQGTMLIYRYRGLQTNGRGQDAALDTFSSGPLRHLSTEKVDKFTLILPK